MQKIRPLGTLPGAGRILSCPESGFRHFGRDDLAGFTHVTRGCSCLLYLREGAALCVLRAFPESPRSTPHDSYPC